MNSQLKLGAFLSYFSIGLSIIAGLVYTPWMIRQIGQSDFGLYTLANSLISLFVIDLGLGLATSRYIAKYRAEGNFTEMSRFLGIVFKLYLFLDLVLLIVLSVVFLFIDSIYVSLMPAEIERLKVVYCIAAVFSVLDFPCLAIEGILNAYEKFIQLKFAEVMFRVINIGLTITALLMRYGLYAVVSIQAFAGIVAAIYKIWAIKRYTPIRADFHFFDKRLFKDLFSFSFWATATTLAQRLIFNITPSILGMVANSIHVAIFGVVTSIEAFTFMIVNAINGMFMAKISRMYVQNKTEELLNLLVKVGRFQYSLNGLIVVGFAIVGKKFIDMWVGQEYSDAYYGILLVLVPGIFYSALQIANTSLIVTKKINLQAYVTIIIGVINFALSFFLSQKWGVLGACSSICVAYVIRAVLLNIIYYKKLQINIRYFLIHCYLKMSVPIVATLILFYPLYSIFSKTDGWLFFGIEGVLVCIVYGIMTFIFGLEKNERNFVLKKMKIF